MNKKLLIALLVFYCSGLEAKELTKTHDEAVLLLGVEGASSVAGLCDSFYDRGTRNYKQCLKNVMEQNHVILINAFNVASFKTSKQNLKARDNYINSLKGGS